MTTIDAESSRLAHDVILFEIKLEGNYTVYVYDNKEHTYEQMEEDRLIPSVTG